MADGTLESPSGHLKLIRLKYRCIMILGLSITNLSVLGGML
jgi:hypothetical protein